MMTPKRFKLAAAVRDKDPGDGLPLQAVVARDGYLWASDGRVVARVPLLGPEERPGADLPRLEPGEAPPAVLAPRAWAEATKGRTGEGRVVAQEDATEASAGPGKGWVRHGLPHAAPGGAVWQSLQGIVERAQEPAGGGARTVEVSLDAKALMALSIALGGEGGIRLRFHVGGDGRPDAAQGAILVQPVDDRGADAPLGVIMAILGGA